MPQSENYAPQDSNKVKNLFWSPDTPASQRIRYFPHFYIEARIDFNDVRTGFRETISLSKALEIYSNDADSLWADDMVREVDQKKIGSVMPDYAHLTSLPEYVDSNFISRMETQFIQYLLRSFKVRVYRNFGLNVYSSSGESASEFTDRCRELLDGGMRREFDNLREVFSRKIEQLRQKYLRADDSGEVERAKADSAKNDVFSQASEQIADLFLGAESVFSCRTPEPLRFSLELQELDERLAALYLEARRAIKKVHDSNEEKAGAIDEYILHPDLRDIHFVRSCILWMPARAV